MRPLAPVRSLHGRLPEQDLLALTRDAEALSRLVELLDDPRALAGQGDTLRALAARAAGRVQGGDGLRGAEVRERLDRLGAIRPLRALVRLTRWEVPILSDAEALIAEGRQRMDTLVEQYRAAPHGIAAYGMLLDGERESVGERVDAWYDEAELWRLALARAEGELPRPEDRCETPAGGSPPSAKPAGALIPPAEGTAASAEPAVPRSGDPLGLQVPPAGGRRPERDGATAAPLFTTAEVRP